MLEHSGEYRIHQRTWASLMELQRFHNYSLLLLTLLFTPCFYILSSGGSYVFTETSSPQVKGDTAALISNVLQGPAGCKLNFWYHMYGADMGSLTVHTQTSDGEVDKQIWSLSGDQGDQWINAEVRFTQELNSQVGIDTI